MKSSLKILFVLLALLLPALLINLGNRPIYKIQEVRVAETAREMLASGDWVIPRYNGELRLQKPPLPYWLTATSYRLAGINEVATRLPAVLFGLLSAALLWCWIRRESGVTTAANSVVVLVVSYLGLRYFRSGEADSVLLFFINAASLLGYDILHGRHDNGRRWLFGLMLGLGFLSKGPAALAIPALTVVAVAIAEKRAGCPRPSAKPFFSLPGVMLLLLAAFGWYAWIFLKYPDVAPHFLGRQVDETFVSGTHAKPVWWYLANGFGFFAPWGVLLIPAGWAAYRQRGAPLPPLIRFAWIWLAVVFVLLTATANKQTQYALLFSPPLAIILGHYLTEAKGGFAKANRLLFWLFCAAAVAGIIFALRKSSDIPLDLIWLGLPVAPLIVQRLLREKSLSSPVLLVAGITVMAYLYSEANLSKEPRKVAAQIVMQEAAGHSPLYQTLDDGALSFYAGRVVPPVDAKKELPRLLDEHAELWLVGEDIPEWPGVDSQVMKKVEDLTLYKLQRKH